MIVALLALLLVGATPAQADEVFRLAPPTAEVSVVQGQSAPVSIPLVASGVIECTDSATVSLSTLYFVGPAGGSAAGTPASVRLGAGASVGDGDCVPAWAGTPSPYAVAASVRADAHAAPGDYRVPLTLGVDGVETADHAQPGECALEAKHADEDNPRPHVDCTGGALTVHVLAAPPPPAAPRPTLGQTVELSLVSGNVRYRTPGATTQALGASPVIVPNGTVVDALLGHVNVIVERDSSGALDSAETWAGTYTVAQSAGGITTFTLASALGDAEAGHAAARSAASRKPRHLWVAGKGNFKTRGKRASAVLRGTTWLTEETSAGTAVVVKEGAVAVRDFGTKKTHLVPAGHSYLARKPVHLAPPRFTG